MAFLYRWLSVQASLYNFLLFDKDVGELHKILYSKTYA